MTGRYYKPEWKEALKSSIGDRTGKNNPFYGKKHSNATKERISVKNARNSLLLYVLIVFIAFLISLKSPILYPRYLMTITGTINQVFPRFYYKEGKKINYYEILVSYNFYNGVNEILLLAKDFDKRDLNNK